MTMRKTTRFSGSARIRGHVVTRLTLGLATGVATSCSMPDDPSGLDADAIAAGDGELVSEIPVCTSGPIRCLAHVRTLGTSQQIESHVVPSGFGAADLQAAYQIDPARTASEHPTVAIVNAYGYAALEADLAVYRAQYGLPACTIAGGCLTIVNQQGKTSPLPANPPPSDDWTVEAALDLDMVSAACPRCNILVVEATNSDDSNLYAAEDAAAALKPTVISNSWGGPETTTIASDEAHFDHPGIATFAAAGDFGYDDQFSPMATGPDYPATSAHVIAVGATHLSRDTSARGWSETAWSVTGNRTKSAGGSACSLAIPKPAYQTDSPCAFKATTDIAAVGDPATGVAVYNAANAGWMEVGGTSAGSPLIAAMFAATGNGGQTSGAFIAGNASKLNDVVSGNNGTCTSSRLCNAGVGWDGPTGYGTPDASALMTSGGGGGGGGGCSAGGGAGVGGVLGLALLTRRRRRSGSATSWR